LKYFGARFYDPEVGRFITVDPGKDGLNWYAYCNNNPLRYVDPDGRVLVDLSLESIKATGKWILNNAGALVEIGSGALLTVLGYGADAATGAAVLATDGAAIVAVPGEQALSAGAKAAGAVMMAHGAAKLKGGNSHQAGKEKPGTQDKLLTKGEIQKLKDAGNDIHELKGGKNASKYDLYKKDNGDIVVKPKGGAGEGDYTGLNIKNY
jgi:uncharacterized protein RhaS with RHS repeats